jgi:CubicO group peptidase (beta-lactamase class C family)
MGTAAMVEGNAAPGFEPVRAVFQRLIRTAKGGAAFAAYHCGEPVVDLWGGVADTEGTPWDDNTIVTIFSGTKGLVAAAMALLVDRGEVAVEAPMSQYWPEFGAQDKAEVTVAEVLSHRAGLPALAGSVALTDFLDDVTMAARLAAQERLWTSGEVAYHGLTYGWLAGELVRRITGRSIGNYFAEEMARPLELETWLGLPSEMLPRTAQLQLVDSFRREWQEAVAIRLVPAVYGNAEAFAEPLFWNRTDARRCEIPAANAVSSARSMAKLYAYLARCIDDRTLAPLSAATIASCTAELSRGVDAINGEPLAFGLGFELQTRRGALGPAPDAFGHRGAGGSAHGAWPTLETSFSFATNELAGEAQDVRARALLASLYGVVAAGPQRSV